MEDAYHRELTQLTSRLARFFSARSTTPKVQRYRTAYVEICSFAERHGHDEEWCDRVFGLMIEGRAGDAVGHSARAA